MSVYVRACVCVCVIFHSLLLYACMPMYKICVLPVYYFSIFLGVWMCVYAYVSRMRVYMCVCIILHFPTSVCVYGMRVCVYIPYTCGASVSMNILAFFLAFRCVYACICCMRVYECMCIVCFHSFLPYVCVCVFASVCVLCKECMCAFGVYMRVFVYFKTSLRSNINSNNFVHSQFSPVLEVRLAMILLHVYPNIRSKYIKKHKK